MKAVFAVVLLFAMPVTTGADARALRLLREWIAAVNEYQPGVMTPRVEVLVALSDAELATLQPYIDAAIAAQTLRSDKPARRRRIDQRDRDSIASLARDIENLTTFRKRAAALHTDLALSGAGSDKITTLEPDRARGLRVPVRRRLMVRSHDGLLGGFEAASLHWEVAMDMVNALDRADAFVPLWYRAVGAYFAREYRFGDALLHWDRARDAGLAQPSILYGEACLHEILAAPPVQEFVRKVMLPNAASIEGVGSARSHWARAERLLQMTLSGDASFHDARVRLARVKSLLGKHDEALALSRDLVTAELGVLAFYANLIAGDALEHLGDVGAAQTHYGRAMRLYPRAQSARLAVAHTLRAVGDKPGAASLLTPALTNADNDEDDPWWIYYQGDGPNFDRLIGQLRAASVAPAP